MRFMPRFPVVLAAVFGFYIPLNGQVVTRQPGAAIELSSPMVTARAARDHIRFTALTIGSRMRLEILSRNGNTLFDSGFRSGNLIEWPLGDERGSRLSDGVYGCIVAVEDRSGRVAYRRGLFRLSDGKAVFDAPAATQAEEVSIVSGDDSISIVGADDRFRFTFVGHNGTDARIESTAGGLILHAGRFYGGEADQSPHLH